MKRAGLLGMAVVAMLGLAVASAQAGKPKKIKVPTDASVESQATNDPDPASGFIVHGEVSSRKTRCVRGRLVELHRILGGEDEVVGTAEAAEDGSWTVDVGHILWNTDYYAVVERAKHRKKHKRKLICKATRSPNTFITSAP